jgi:L-lactate dehydrogenase complex protein LldG
VNVPAAPFPQPPLPPQSDESLFRQVPATLDRAALVERWIERAAAFSIKIHRATHESFTSALDACLAPHKIARALVNAHEYDPRLAAYLAAKGIHVIPWATPNCAEEAFSCELSITDCRVALADTGSLMFWSDATFGRASTLVIPIHVVLLPASRILPDLVDGLAFIQRHGPLPSNIVLINGPSKTADIEMNMITGVHGPKHLYVVVIDDMQK